MARGRPRKCDPEAALEDITRTFWERGYEGTTLSDLTAATGAAKPSLYAAFGDKEAMYEKALQHYVVDLGAPAVDILMRPGVPLRVSLRQHLDAVIAASAKEGCPQGCFLVNALAEIGAMPKELAVFSRALEERRRNIYRQRFRIAKDAGELPAEADPDAIGDFFAGQVMAAALMLRSGTDIETVRRTMEVALKVLPAEL